MAAAKTRGKRLGQEATPAHLVSHTEMLVGTTDTSIRQIQEALVVRFTNQCRVFPGSPLRTRTIFGLQNSASNYETAYLRGKVSRSVVGRIVKRVREQSNRASP